MTQKELKQLYAQILTTDVWHKDIKMVDYCVNKTAYIVELQNGDIIPIEKPRIEKDFCFGYSDSRYDTEDYDRASDMANHASTSENYFITKNLKDIDNTIAELEGEKLNYFQYYIRISYTGQPDNSKLKALHQLHFDKEIEGKDYNKLEGENLKRVIEGYKIVKTDFEKRLKTYLKRYGMSKVKAWSYWRDE